MSNQGRDQSQISWLIMSELSLKNWNTWELGANSHDWSREWSWHSQAPWSNYRDWSWEESRAWSWSITDFVINHSFPRHVILIPFDLWPNSWLIMRSMIDHGGIFLKKYIFMCDSNSMVRAIRLLEKIPNWSPMLPLATIKREKLSYVKILQAFERFRFVAKCELPKLEKLFIFMSLSS